MPAKGAVIAVGSTKRSYAYGVNGARVYRLARMESHGRIPGDDGIILKQNSDEPDARVECAGDNDEKDGSFYPRHMKCQKAFEFLL